MVSLTRFYAATVLACMMALGPFSHLSEGEILPAILAMGLMLMSATVAWNHRLWAS
jgi:hypothetical protein